MSQVASLFTLFTHHAKTTESLILSLRNNLLQTRVFNNEKVAEQQVAEVINFDIHLNKDLSGRRYIERITEIIPLSHYSDYPEEYKKATNGEEREALFMDTVKTFFERMTDRKTFITRDIIRFNNGAYEAVNKPTQRTINEMKKFFEVKEQKELGCFLEREFTLDFGGLCDG